MEIKYLSNHVIEGKNTKRMGYVKIKRNPRWSNIDWDCNCIDHIPGPLQDFFWKREPTLFCNEVWGIMNEGTRSKTAWRTMAGPLCGYIKGIDHETAEKIASYIICRWNSLIAESNESNKEAGQLVA
jgi:hypothetical protein